MGDFWPIPLQREEGALARCLALSQQKVFASLLDAAQQAQKKPLVALERQIRTTETIPARTLMMTTNMSLGQSKHTATE